MLEGIHWLGHSSFRLELEGITIYIDPWQLKHPTPADLVLVTHDHHDHLSPQDIEAVSKQGTKLVYAGKEPAKLKGEKQLVKPFQKLTFGAAQIETVPAYNLHKPFHPHAANYVGYIVELGGMRIYHAGDTDVIPEMADIRCDVALLPVGGKFTMDAKEAASALEIIKPRYAVPMHYGALIGGDKDARTFQELAPKSVEVILPVKE